MRKTPEGHRPAADGDTDVILPQLRGPLQVLVDGIEHGRTPTTLSVAAGAHVLEVRGGNAPRVMSINVAGGVENTQYVEFANLPQNALRDESAGVGAAAALDAGSARTPLLTVTDRAPDAREAVPTATGSNPAVAPPTWGWIFILKARKKMDTRLILWA